MSYLNELEAVWQQVKEKVASVHSAVIANMWFETLKLHSFEDQTIVFETTSEFNYKVLSKTYTPHIKDGFADILGFKPEVRVVFTGEPSSPERIIKQLGLRPEAKEESKPKAEGALPIDYSFQYTFDNFIVGSSNEFAHAACTAVARIPATDYNPLFIYGPSGLGKTHLMSAIVNEIKKNNPSARVIYIKGDDFTNQMIEALSRNEMYKFHEKYRNCDILLIDDIQFIAGKDATQEEFFHTFNTLYEDRKQIVLSSDRPPKDIQTLEERLKTRFEWGLIADIQPPDLELRTAIIKKKAEQVPLEIPNDVLIYLAENLRSNIRQIEGTIKKLSALVFLKGQEITMAAAVACLNEITGGVVPVQVVIDKIFSAVYNKYGVGKSEILSGRRNKEIAFARHVCIYLIRNVTEMSFPGIGKIFNRDHTTMISSYELIQKRRNTDAVFNAEISELLEDVSGMQV